jgi:hypothetical protein
MLLLLLMMRRDAESHATSAIRAAAARRKRRVPFDSLPPERHRRRHRPGDAAEGGSVAELPVGKPDRGLALLLLAGKIGGDGTEAVSCLPYFGGITINEASGTRSAPARDALASAPSGRSVPAEGDMGIIDELLKQVRVAWRRHWAVSAGLPAFCRGSVTPQDAQRVPPDAVQALAQQAAAKDPSIVDTAAGFHAQHPTLVKTIGAGALALLMSKISAARSNA